MPGSDETQTCSDECPLSTDSSVAFQDFLFTSAPIFGVQINLKDWTGAGAGLHLLQLLSDGSSFTLVLFVCLLNLHRRFLCIGRLTWPILLLLSRSFRCANDRYMDASHRVYLHPRHHPNSLNKHSCCWLDIQSHPYLEHLYFRLRPI